MNKLSERIKKHIEDDNSVYYYIEGHRNVLFASYHTCYEALQNLILIENVLKEIKDEKNND